jgi:outer membrane protein assembly factor BamE (lipoprotein component of BamABCDE complex)
MQLKKTFAIVAVGICFSLGGPAPSAFSEPTFSRGQAANFQRWFRPGMTRSQVQQMVGKSNRGNSQVDAYRLNGQDSTYLGIIYDANGRTSTFTYYTPRPKRNFFGF